MIYSFESTEYNLYNIIDAKNIFNKLSEVYEIEDKNELSLKIKEVIKKPKEFNELCENLEVEIKEMFIILPHIFPDIFTNKRTVSSISKIYKKIK